MSTITISVVIDVPLQHVWDEVADVAGHVHWMADAVAIRFTSARHHGVGTTFECDTRFGPFSLVDRMEITEWRPPSPPRRDRATMGVRHAGLVTGEGRFTLRPANDEDGEDGEHGEHDEDGEHGEGRSRTLFTWTERLAFPWWLGGPVGGLAAKPLMRTVWRRNLGRLKGRVERAARMRPSQTATAGSGETQIKGERRPR